jgi:CheY-like chemotaxis protein
VGVVLRWGAGTVVAHILVVDDDLDLRTTLCELLQEGGFETVGAAHGEEAMSLLTPAHPLPALILLDLMMPVMNGWQLIEALRQTPRLAAIPVVVMTAGRSLETAPLLGAEIVLKPVRLAALMTLARRYLVA